MKRVSRGRKRNRLRVMKSVLFKRCWYAKVNGRMTRKVMGVEGSIVGVVELNGTVC